MTKFGATLHPRAIAFCTALLTLLAGTCTAHAAWAQFGAPVGASGGIAGWVFAEQAAFYRALAQGIRSARSDGSALWALMGISFVYGIFHAAGPGHGKAVISSYLFANGETWRRGMALSFASAAMQSVTAIAIVGIAAVLLGATAKLMGDTVRVIEIVSYGLIVALGARLLWVKGHGLRAALRALHPQECAGHSTFAHDHSQCDAGASKAFQCQADHHHGPELDVLPWGHAHGPEPEELAGPGGWRRGLSAIVAVGLRPCSGAIIVLVFALAQGLFWAGVASTLVMGLGTAITVGVIATLAVAARGIAKRVAAKPDGYSGVLLRGLECAAAALVLTFGGLLLTGYMASERMGLF